MKALAGLLFYGVPSKYFSLFEPSGRPDPDVSTPLCWTDDHHFRLGLLLKKKKKSDSAYSSPKAINEANVASCLPSNVAEGLPMEARPALFADDGPPPSLAYLNNESLCNLWSGGFMATFAHRLHDGAVRLVLVRRGNGGTHV